MTAKYSPEKTTAGSEGGVHVNKCGSEPIKVGVERRCKALHADTEPTLQYVEDGRACGGLIPMTLYRLVSQQHSKEAVVEIDVRVGATGGWRCPEL